MYLGTSKPLAYNMNSPEVKAFIHEHADLFWYTPKDKVDNISLDFLVEHILNYGDRDVILHMFEILGLNKVKDILEKTTGRNLGNYFPEVYNYFLLYTQRHAS